MSHPSAQHTILPTPYRVRPIQLWAGLVGGRVLHIPHLHSFAYHIVYTQHQKGSRDIPSALLARFIYKVAIATTFLIHSMRPWHMQSHTGGRDQVVPSSVMTTVGVQPINTPSHILSSITNKVMCGYQPGYIIAATINSVPNIPFRNNTNSTQEY